jgi:succinate dehydrogenase / fumarate reductase membrane anchor subunit
MKESTLWLLFLLAGILILVTLTIHMGVMHIDSLLGIEDVLSYESAVARGKDIFYASVYTILLGAALYHGLYGLRTVLSELSLPRGLERIISWAFLLFGAVIFVYGFWAIRMAYSL